MVVSMKTTHDDKDVWLPLICNFSGENWKTRRMTMNQIQKCEILQIKRIFCVTIQVVLRYSINWIHWKLVLTMSAYSRNDRVGYFNGFLIHSVLMLTESQNLRDEKRPNQAQKSFHFFNLECICALNY